MNFINKEINSIHDLICELKTKFDFEANESEIFSWCREGLIEASIILNDHDPDVTLVDFQNRSKDFNRYLNKEIDFSDLRRCHKNTIYPEMSELVEGRILYIDKSTFIYPRTNKNTFKFQLLHPYPNHSNKKAAPVLELLFYDEMIRFDLVDEEHHIYNKFLAITDKYLEKAFFIPDIKIITCPPEYDLNTEILGFDVTYQLIFTRDEIEYFINRNLGKFTYDEIQHNPKNNNSSEQKRNNMLKLIWGIAISKYGYNSENIRNTATGTNAGSIQADLDNLGITLTDDTIRKYLKEADKLFK